MEEKGQGLNNVKGDKKYEVMDIEEMFQEENPFQAYGYSYLKVTRGDITRAVKIKIQGMPQELADAASKRSPKAPVKIVMLDPDSPEGRELGVRTRQKAQIPDYTDTEYQQKLEEHNVRFRQEVVGNGVLSVLKKPDGEVAATPEEKYKALERMGLSTLHFNQLAEDILGLTKWTDQEQDQYFRR